MSKQAKYDIKTAVQASKYPPIIHFDGKTLFEMRNGKRFKNERLAVLLNIDGEVFLLGVPVLSSSSGEDQYKGVMNLLKEYGIKGNVGGLCFDTTSSNTGANKGSLFRIAKDLEVYPLFLACRHHVSELKIVHFHNAVTQKKTSGPENPLFKKLKDIFETPEFNQDANDLTKFYWKKARGTVIECAALESLNFCKEYLKRKEVLRDERKELAELVVGYLSPGHVKIRKPGAMHHARFVQDDKLLQEEISIMVEFVACFYAKWYLQSDSAIRAPYLDISSLHQMHLYRDVCAKPEAVDAVLGSFYKHTWYLDSIIVPLSLLDEDEDFTR